MAVLGTTLSRRASQSWMATVFPAFMNASCNSKHTVLFPTPPFFARIVMVILTGDYGQYTDSTDTVQRLSSTPCNVSVRPNPIERPPASRENRA